ncbi:MAG: hypothetical protein AB8B87_00125 [Granulosicoccus sp.]
MRLGQPSRIWRDDKLQGNDVFSDEIMRQFGNTAVLLSILTPRYQNSEWCTREISEFCNAAKQDGGVVFDNKARIFKVLKASVDTEETLPPVAKEVLGYEFFTYGNEVPLELEPAYGEEFVVYRITGLSAENNVLTVELKDVEQKNEKLTVQLDEAEQEKIEALNEVDQVKNSKKLSLMSDSDTTVEADR